MQYVYFGLVILIDNSGSQSLRSVLMYREIRLYIFYMWLYTMSLKNLMFCWYCLEGRCASFILGHNE